MLVFLLTVPALPAAQASGRTAGLPVGAPAVATMPRRTEPLDINTASAQDLLSLPGMGAAGDRGKAVYGQESNPYPRCFAAGGVWGDSRSDRGAPFKVNLAKVQALLDVMKVLCRGKT